MTTVTFLKYYTHKAPVVLPILSNPTAMWFTGTCWPLRIFCKSASISPPGSDLFVSVQLRFGEASAILTGLVNLQFKEIDYKHTPGINLKLDLYLTWLVSIQVLLISQSVCIFSYKRNILWPRVTSSNWRWLYPLTLYALIRILAVLKAHHKHVYFTQMHGDRSPECRASSVKKNNWHSYI